MTNKRKLQRIKHSQSKNTLDYRLWKCKQPYVHSDEEMFYDPFTDTFYRVPKAEVLRLTKLFLDERLIPEMVCKIDHQTWAPFNLEYYKMKQE